MVSVGCFFTAQELVPYDTYKFINSFCIGMLIAIVLECTSVNVNAYESLIVHDFQMLLKRGGI